MNHKMHSYNYIYISSLICMKKNTLCCSKDINKEVESDKNLAIVRNITLDTTLEEQTREKIFE